MSRTVAQHRPLRVRVARRVRDAIWSMKDPQDMGYLLGKQYRVRIATAWSRAKQMLKEAKIDLIVVVLPMPLRPSSVTTSPSRTPRSIPKRMRLSP